MKNILELIININFKKILTTFLIGSLLVVSTACSQGNIAQVGEQAIADTVQKVSSNDYDQYDAKQPFKGGMNGYNDDRRYDAKTAAKTKALVDNAERVQNRSFGENTDEVIDRLGNKVTAIPDNLKENQAKAANYLEDKSDNLQRNLSKVPSGAKKVFDGAVDTAQDAIEDANKATRNTAREFKRNIEDLS